MSIRRYFSVFVSSSLVIVGIGAAAVAQPVAAAPELVGRCVSGVTPDGHYVEVTARRDTAADQQVIVEAAARRRVPLKEAGPIDDPTVGVDRLFLPVATVARVSLRGGTTDAPRVVTSRAGRRASLSLVAPSAAPEWWSVVVTTSVGTMACRLKVATSAGTTSGR